MREKGEKTLQLSEQTSQPTKKQTNKNTRQTSEHNRKPIERRWLRFKIPRHSNLSAKKGKGLRDVGHNSQRTSLTAKQRHTTTTTVAFGSRDAVIDLFSRKGVLNRNTVSKPSILLLRVRTTIRVGGCVGYLRTFCRPSFTCILFVCFFLPIQGLSTVVF